jgi:hypothetical protein
MYVPQVEVSPLGYHLQLVVRQISEFRLDGTQVVINAKPPPRIIRGKHLDGTGRTHWRGPRVTKKKDERVRANYIKAG